MLELIVLGIVATVAWFWYTDRRNTQTAIKTSAGVVFGTTRELAKAVKAEADIAKAKNDIADLETDRLQKFADRNAERTVKSLLSDVGLDDDFKASQAKRLEEVVARLEEARRKANAKK